MDRVEELADRIIRFHRRNAKDILQAAYLAYYEDPTHPDVETRILQACRREARMWDHRLRIPIDEADPKSLQWADDIEHQDWLDKAADAVMPLLDEMHWRDRFILVCKNYYNIRHTSTAKSLKVTRSAVSQKHKKVLREVQCSVRPI